MYNDCRFVHSKFTNKPLELSDPVHHLSIDYWKVTRRRTVQLIGVFRNRDTIMKLAACMVLAVAEAKLKIKNLDIPDASFFTFAHSDEKHMGLPDNNPAYSKYFEPTQRERDYHGACFHGSPHDMGIKDGQNSENSHWRCALVNKKRKNANSPRDFVCFPQCADWTKKKQNSNPNSFTGCRLHAPITNRK